MHDLMMAEQLNIALIMEHAEQTAAHVEIVALLSDGEQHRYNYAQAFSRVRQLANALDHLHTPSAASVGILAWDDHRNFELHYAVPCSGRICHSINSRLSPEQIVYSINHAGDHLLFVDPQFIPLLERIHLQLPQVRHYVALCTQQQLIPSCLPNLISYEALLARQNNTYQWPELDERTPSSLCYTSRDGQLKAVQYSQRSTVLHSMAANLATGFAVGDTVEVVLPLVPLHSVNAWGLLYSAVLAGNKLVLPGPNGADARAVCELINAEQVTYAVAVPSLWQSLLDYLDEHAAQIPSLRRGVAGGAACALSLIERMAAYGVRLETAWGMAETSALGCYNRYQPWYQQLSNGAREHQLCAAGRQVFGLRLRVVDAQGQPLPRDGYTTGTVQVRGPWVASGYLGGSSQAGWFDSGDVGSIDDQGYVRILDRSKDLIKSGGEWISSATVENAMLAHPQVLHAAVIGLPHRRWSQRPLLIVVPQPGAQPDRQQLLRYLEGRVAKWWIPDACVMHDALPHTANGKLSKSVLRRQYAEVHWSELLA